MGHGRYSVKQSQNRDVRGNEVVASEQNADTNEVL
jgi:hypothetical protein